MPSTSFPIVETKATFELISARLSATFPAPPTLKFLFIMFVTGTGASGEILLQSVDQDGSLLGYDLKLLDYIENIQLPLIVSSGAGNWDHVKKVLEKDFVSAASLTNIFHFTEKSIRNLKNHIKKYILIRE